MEALAEKYKEEDAEEEPEEGKESEKAGSDEENVEKVDLKEPFSSRVNDNREDDHPRNGVDGNNDTFFALQGGKEDGYW